MSARIAGGRRRADAQRLLGRLLARAASGHAIAAPPSAAINFRRPIVAGMVTVIERAAYEAFHNADHLHRTDASRA